MHLCIATYYSMKCVLILFFKLGKAWFYVGVLHISNLLQRKLSFWYFKNISYIEY